MKRPRVTASRLVPLLLVAGAAGAVAAVLASRRRRGIQLFRSVTVGAPTEAVYDFWSRFDCFPDCFTHIKTVSRTGNDNEWRWTIAGPGGDEVEWDTWVTESIPGKSIAWESAPGSRIKAAGVVQFTEAGPHSTRVDVRMSYRPHGRGAARALSAAFGPDPAAALDQCLARLQAKFDEDVLASTD